MWPTDPDWQTTALFVVAVGLLWLVMKLAAVRLSLREGPKDGFMWSVVLAPSSLSRRRPLGQFSRQVIRFFTYFGAAVLAYWIWWGIIVAAPIPPIFLGYGAVFILLLVSECFSSLVAVASAPSGQLFPALHNSPLRASSVADFWGNRWNLWFSDWFRYAIFSRMRRRPAAAVIVVFAVSGLMHEWAVNRPLYLATGRILFGSMMIYFLLQGVGVRFERRWLRGRSRKKRVFAWLIVFGPAPLILNEGLMRALHLWPG